MYTTMLVPLDGSRRAEKILAYIEPLAERFAAAVLLLQVCDAAPLEVFAESADAIEVLGQIQERTKDAQRYLAGIEQRLVAKNLPVKSLVEYGPVVATILKVAKREEADLIALASHGRTGLAQVVYGSVAAGILRLSARPLLLIRARDG